MKKTDLFMGFAYAISVITAILIYLFAPQHINGLLVTYGVLNVIEMAMVAVGTFVLAYRERKQS